MHLTSALVLLTSTLLSSLPAAAAAAAAAAPPPRIPQPLAARALTDLDLLRPRCIWADHGATRSWRLELNLPRPRDAAAHSPTATVPTSSDAGPGGADFVTNHLEAAVRRQCDPLLRFRLELMLDGQYMHREVLLETRPDCDAARMQRALAAVGSKATCAEGPVPDLSA